MEESPDDQLDPDVKAKRTTKLECCPEDETLKLPTAVLFRPNFPFASGHLGTWTGAWQTKSFEKPRFSKLHGPFLRSTKKPLKRPEHTQAQLISWIAQLVMHSFMHSFIQHMFSEDLVFVGHCFRLLWGWCEEEERVLGFVCSQLVQT